VASTIPVSENIRKTVPHTVLVSFATTQEASCRPNERSMPSMRPRTPLPYVQESPGFRRCAQIEQGARSGAKTAARVSIGTLER